jgi:hypothetical protein
MTVNDLKLVLDDLFGPKKALLDKTLTFKIYGPGLKEQKDSIDTIHKALQKRPLSEELLKEDEIHDTSARAIHLFCKGMGELATLDQEKRSLLRKVSDTFVPSLGDLKKSYEDEAAAAKKREKDLVAMKAELEAFPVAPSTTLYTLVSTYIESGKKLDSLLSSRAETTADDIAKRTKEVAALRSRTVGALGQMREALSHEVSSNPELPRDLVGKIFSYFDQLAESRQGRYHPPTTDPQTPTA